MSVTSIPSEKAFCPRTNGYSLNSDAITNYVLQISHDNHIGDGMLREFLDNQTLSDRLNVVRRLVGGRWKKASDIKIERITGGLSNYLFKLSLNDVKSSGDEQPRSVLVRVYGDTLRNDVDAMITDSVIFSLLSERGVGPQLFGVFSGGRIEEFIESRVVRTDELCKPHMTKRIAHLLVQLHELQMPISKTPDRYFQVIRGYLENLQKNNDQLEDGGQKIMKKYNFEEECAWMRSVFLEDHPSAFPVVFCHNDFQENNILLCESPNDEGGFKLRAIDFEHSSYGFRGFDVANFFNEWCYDYTETKAPYYSYTPENYPSKEVQINFWRSYFKFKRSIDKSGNCLGEEEITPELAEKLLTEVSYGSVLSHLYWGLWSLIQSLVSTIDFGYVEYGILRLEAYIQDKAKLPSIA